MKDNIIAEVAGHHSVPVWLRAATVALYAASVAVVFYFVTNGSHLESTINYELFVRPPGWVFQVIWPVIYLAFCIALVYAAIKDQWPQTAYWATIGISIMNALWAWVFSMGKVSALLWCLLIIIALAAALYTLWTTLYSSLNQGFMYYFSRNAVSLFMGWILAALHLNIGMVLVHALGLSQKAFTIMFWISLVLLYLLVTWVAYSREGSHGLKCLIGFWLAGLWAMTGALLSTLNHKSLM